MLSEEHRREYQEFRLLVEQFQNLATQENLDRVGLLNSSKEMMEFFSDRLVPLGNAELNPAGGSPLQSYITEIHKQLRLVGMDVTFLQASKSEGNTQMRKEAISDRLQTIIDYCSTLLSKND